MQEKNSISTLAQQVSTKSVAVNPSLWCCLVISLPLFYLMTKVEGWLQIAFFIVALIPLLSFAISYFYLLFTNPDYLRSEEYQLRAAAMNLFGDKDNPLNANANDVVSMVNNPQLPSPRENK